MLENVSCTQLSCGARVVTSEIPTAESVVFGMLVDIGSRYEKSSQAGSCHFLEHMLFKGTPSRNALQISQAIESRGGSLNAFTSEDATLFHVRIPHEEIERAVDVYIDMYLNASIDSDEFNRERDVILEELAMYRDQPSSVVFENLGKSVYCNHPLGAPVIGNKKSLAAMTAEKLRAFKQKNYIPGNTVFAFAGRIRHEDAVRMISSRLGKAKRGILPKPILVEETTRQEPFVVEEKDVNQIQIALGFRSVGLFDECVPAQTLLDAILGDNMSSRLFQTVREKHGLCYAISTSRQMYAETGIFSVSLGCAPNQAKSALKLVAKELSKICEKPVPSAELARAKSYVSGTFRLGTENSSAQMIYIAGSMQRFGRFIPPQERLDKILAVDKEALRQTARQTFDKTKATLSLVVPKGCKVTRDEWLDSLKAL